VVVLHELVLDAQLGEQRAPVGLDEKPALVAVRLRTQEDGSLEPCRESLHGAPQRS